MTTLRRMTGFLRQELAESLRLFGRVLVTSTLTLTVLGTLLLASGLLTERRASLSEVPVFMAVSLYYGLFVGAALACAAVLWRLFGPTMLVTALLAPLGFFGVLWLFHGWVADLGLAFLDASLAAARARGFPHAAQAVSGLRLGCSGGALIPLVLALMAPFLVADFVSTFAEPAVAWRFLGFAAAMGGVLVGAILLAFLLSGPALAIAFARRAHQRYRSFHSC